jgi:hypothetical protein
MEQSKIEEAARALDAALVEARRAARADAVNAYVAALAAAALQAREQEPGT